MPTYTLDPGPIPPASDDLPPIGGAADFSGLVGQALSDLGGVDARFDTIARPLVDLPESGPADDLSPHEADLIASQQADRATLGELYATDATAAGDAVNSRQDGAFHDVNDVRAAHAGLSPDIDAGRAEIPDEVDVEQGHIIEPRDDRWPRNREGKE